MTDAVSIVSEQKLAMYRKSEETHRLLPHVDLDYRVIQWYLQPESRIKLDGVST